MNSSSVRILCYCNNAEHLSKVGEASVGYYGFVVNQTTSTSNITMSEQAKRAITEAQGLIGHAKFSTD